MDEYFLNQFELGKTYVIAVSGGVDSIVLLDRMSKIEGIKIIVAHFDHQIRGRASADDAELVRQLAKQHNFQYEIARGGLGEKASEDQARRARYSFLRQVASENQAQLVVAHHFDDVIETVAINLKRGTGWQGLAVMGAEDIIRPLINVTKEQIINYAKENDLKWHEDETNSSDKYLRNQLRQQIKDKIPFENRAIVYEYYQKQKALRRAIFFEARKFYHQNRKYSRYFWIMIDHQTAVELFRQIIGISFSISITIPQAEQAIVAVKTAKEKTVYQVGEGVSLKFTKKNFHIDFDKS